MINPMKTNTTQAQGAREHNINRSSPNHGAEDAFAEWKTRGLCHTSPNLVPEDFYNLHSKTQVHIQMLRDTCDVCPVRPECHELGRKEPLGFLAGHTEEERYRAKRNAARRKSNIINKDKIAEKKKTSRERNKEAFVRSEARRLARESAA